MLEEVPQTRRPVYPISIASELLGVHPQTLRIYEDKGLAIPARRGQWRFFSEEDLAWVKVIRYLLHEKSVCLTGLQRMLALIPCWDVNRCSQEEREACAKFGKKGSPCWVTVPCENTKCHACRVYKGAAHYVCDSEELAAIARAGNQDSEKRPCS